MKLENHHAKWFVNENIEYENNGVIKVAYLRIEDSENSYISMSCTDSIRQIFILLFVVYRVVEKSLTV